MSPTARRLGPDPHLRRVILEGREMLANLLAIALAVFGDKAVDKGNRRREGIYDGGKADGDREHDVRLRCQGRAVMIGDCHDAAATPSEDLAELQHRLLVA